MPTLDRHGISGAENWQQRLGAMIRDADTVVFVLSLSSARSDICKWEVKEAIRLGKRIVPVAGGPLDGATPPHERNGGSRANNLSLVPCRTRSTSAGRCWIAVIHGWASVLREPTGCGPGHVWLIRAKLRFERRLRDLALFNLAIDSKLRGCDLVALRVGDVAPNGYALDRAGVRQKKTGPPVRFELTKQTRQSVAAPVGSRHRFY